MVKILFRYWLTKSLNFKRPLCLHFCIFKLRFGFTLKNMPLYHEPKTFTPLLIAAEKRSIKNGLHHAVFTSRLDRYKGVWNNDKKEGWCSLFQHIIMSMFQGSFLFVPMKVNIFISGKGYFLTITGQLYEGDWYDGFRFVSWYFVEILQYLLIYFFRYYVFKTLNN